MNLKTGHLLAGGRYKVERVLGHGGFGITYEARDTKFKSRVKSVAIKEFFVENFCNREQETNRIIVATQSKVELVEKLRNKFIDEANALFELEHPGIVRVTDTFEENGTAYYVMEYINGSTLSSIIETDGPLSEEKALGYIRQAAAVLEYLHGQNRLHLDIKPQNIMADNDGGVVLIDFGVSKQYDEVKGENTSTLMGYTPGYAPLEQCNNAVVEFTPTTDIYSLGATLYKLLTGQTPPNASEVNENGLPALPSHISAPVRAAVETAMQPRRKDRPQSVGEFLALLDKNVKAENGKVETESNDDGTTVVGGSVMNNEILRSAQNDKEQKSVISSESEKSLENCENEILRSTQNDKKRPDDNAPQRPFNKRPLTIIYVAAICIIAAFFGIKSCNDRKAAEAEAQHAIAIAEQQRIAAERKAKEEADLKAQEETERLAAEKAEQERIAKETAEKKRKEEEERKRKEEERKAKEEADRLATEEAYSEGVSAYNAGNYSEAVKWYRKAADQGYAKAQYNLGVCYEKGNGVTQSYSDAVKWYRKAADQGHASAQNNLGVCYKNGEGVTQSYFEAVKWYRKAADQGNASAQFNLAICYLNGEGVTQSDSEAVKWYRKAADQGYVRAQHNLGLCYANGNGVPQSDSEAVKWYRKAADQGHASAQSALGYYYENGKGVAQSYSEAVKWYRKAADQGLARAQRALTRLGY